MIALIATLFAPSVAYAQPLPTGVRVVDPSATSGTGDGLTWPNAYTSLETAIDAAISNSAITQIWVKQGIYIPTHPLVPSDVRSKTFRMVSGVGIYGGFNGSETALNQRNPRAYPTILSGDLNGNDTPNFGNRSDNAYHVVTARRINTVSGRHPILDGFIIRGGDAIGAPSADLATGAAAEAGAGIQILANTGNMGQNVISEPIILRCIFEDNRAVKGAGAYILAGGFSPMEFRNCTFRFNRATDGTGIYNDGVSIGKNEALIHNSLFHDNVATGIGSAIYTSNFPEMDLRSCTIAQNYSDGSVGAVKKANTGGIGQGAARIANCIIYDNIRFNSTTPTNDRPAQLDYDVDSLALVRFSCVKDYVNSADGNDVSNITSNPLFDSISTIRLRLQCSSPCINSGSNNALDTKTDLYDLDQDGITTAETNPDSYLVHRIRQTTIDMGAYETNSDPCEADIDGDGIIEIDDLTAVILAWGNCPSGFAGDGEGGGNSMMAGGADAAADDSAGGLQTEHDAILQLLGEGTLSPEQFSEIVEAGLFP